LSIANSHYQVRFDNITMRLLSLIPTLLLASAAVAADAAWSFKDGTVSVVGKGKGGFKES
jgi:hypothetical protein